MSHFFQKKLNVFLVVTTVVLALAVNLANAQEAGFPLPGQSEEAEVTPVNPVHRVYDEEGKVIVVVGTERAFGYRIGDVIPITIIITTDNDDSCKINLETITRKVIAGEGTDFEIVDTAPDGNYPKISITKEKEKVVYRVELKLRSWVIKPFLVFNADFLWATGFLSDTKSPDWHPATTPDLVITTSNTAADISKELLEGDTEQKVSPVPALVFPLRVGGFALLALLPLWMGWRVYRRINPPRVIPPNEIAWAEFDKVFAQKPKTVSYGQVQILAAALRKYFNVESMDSESMRLALEERLALHSKRYQKVEVACSAFAKCDKALYSKLSLSPEESTQLLAEIDSLVPKP